MSRFFTSIFGSQKATAPPVSSLRVDTSLQGVPIALILGGRQRLSVNLIDYYGFASSSGSIAGKGGAFSSSSGTTYSVYVAMGICEGPIASLETMYLNGSIITISFPPEQSTGFDGVSPGIPAGLEYFLGDYVQLPWGVTEADDPSHALAYRGIAYVGMADLDLGSSPSLSNYTFEVTSQNSNVIAGQPDGDVTVAVANFLTNPFWGVGFPVNRLGSLNQWQQYCLALSLLVSPVVASATQASSTINDLCEGTNTAACWQDGQLTFVPYGDQAVAAGSVSTITETHIITSSPGHNPAITVGNVGTFVADLGVTYLNGTPLTNVGARGSLLAAGEYCQLAGTYYFNTADDNQTILITYSFAAVASYVPNSTSLYDFTIDDCLPNQGSIGTGSGNSDSPFLVHRKARDQLYNNIKVEYLDRSSNYNPVDLEVKDEASITAFGRERPTDIKQFHFFCLASAAQQSAALQLARQAIVNTYQWTVGRHFLMILELMAVCTLTDPANGLSLTPVLITEIQENSDFSITITGEDYPGTVSSPQFGTQPNQGANPNYNEPPGSINAPLIFEPTDELGGGLEIWAAVSGQDTSTWGGCYVMVATSPAGSYSQVGKITGPARMGVTTADFPSVSVNPTGQTVDQTNTLAVSLVESAGTLGSATTADALALTDPCYIGGSSLSLTTSSAAASGTVLTFASVPPSVVVGMAVVDMTTAGVISAGTTVAATTSTTVVLSQAVAGAGVGSGDTIIFSASGEVVSYATAVLTGPSAYDLTYLVRGAFGTESEIVDHPSGSAFARLDNAIFEFSYNAAFIGQTLYFKFPSFNTLGGGLQTLDQVPAYSYTVLGTALTSPLPDVTNVYTNYASGFQQIFWDEVTDFRSGILYEIRQGTVWNTALMLKTQAHPPFIAQGNGTFLIKARCQPVSGTIVYSEDAASITISGNQLSLNLLAGFDEKATGWQGTFQNGIGVDGTDLRLGGAGGIVASYLTSAATASGDVLTFTLISTGLVLPGMVVNDLTTPAAIPAGTLVESVTPTSVTLSAPVAGAGVGNGDVIVFSPIIIQSTTGMSSGSLPSTSQPAGYLTAQFQQPRYARINYGMSSISDGLYSLPDVLDFGGIITGTAVYYTIPSTHIVDAGYLVQASVNASAQITGIPVGSNILSIPDILTDTDILGSTSTQFVDGWVEIQVADAVIDTSAPTSSGNTLTFASPPVGVVDGMYVSDLTTNGVIPTGTIVTNVSGSNVTLSNSVTGGGVGSGDDIGFFGSWQKFIPGVFPGIAWNFRLALETSDPQSIPYALSFSFTVQLPSRIDHYQNQTVPNTGLTITFQVDGTSVAAPFNGGPGAANLPYVSVAWQAQTGDYYTITGLSLSQLTINFFNSSNVQVQRTGVNIDVEGY